MRSTAAASNARPAPQLASRLDLSPRRTLRCVEIYCADCGCLVERGVRVVPCGTAGCCCLDLPIRLRTPDQIADQLRTAFATKDLDALGRLLANDARWGDDD